MTMLSAVGVFIALLHATVAASKGAQCLSVTVPDFLTSNLTHCYDDNPVDICTPFNAFLRAGDQTHRNCNHRGRGHSHRGRTCPHKNHGNGMENEAEKVRAIINCTNYDVNYKALELAFLLNDFVASTLPEDQRNESLSQANFIVNWCATGMPLPTFLYNLTCDEYLAQVTVTCDSPVTLSVPDVNNLGQCLNDNPITEVCNQGNTVTWKTFTELIGVIRCIYLSIIPLLPFPEYE
ncbi:uncharacterized protein LOC144142053 [Haemaphysalis longicornis]